jgi:catechol 2,3-dioxygenase-like lactoylglutathione lyase family enzyme
MKRLHVHMSVGDLDQSIRFYSTLFAAAPTVVKPDYAKWMLEDPRVNFAISTHADGAPGIDHLGIQVDDSEELQQIYGRLKDAAGPVLEEGKTTCCYAQSEKSWTLDPQGVSWETFLTAGESTVYGTSAPRVEKLKPVA